MNLRFIPTKVHGFLDYLSVALLPAIPRAFGWGEPVKHLCDGAAIATACSSVMTDYELGLAPVMPMQGHLAMDALTGGVFLASAALMDDEDPAARATMTGLGLFCLGAALMTQTRRARPDEPRGPRMTRGASPMEQFARGRRPQAAGASTEPPSMHLMGGNGPDITYPGAVVGTRAGTVQAAGNI